MSEPVNSVSASGGSDQIDAINIYLNRPDDNDSGSKEYSITNETNETSAANLEESQNVAINTESQAFSNADEITGESNITSAASQEDVKFISQDDVLEVIKGAFIDSDGDGIPDSLDLTGNATLIEQMYDEDAKNKTISEENVRAFASLFAMFGNLDLTRSDNVFLNGDPNSLAVQAMAGIAQVALIKTDLLQEHPNLTISKPEDVQQMIKNYESLTDKRKSLQNLVELTRDASPVIAKIKLANTGQQKQLIKNLDVLNKIMERLGVA